MKPGWKLKLKLKILISAALLPALLISCTNGRQEIKAIEVTEVIDFDKTDFGVSINDIKVFPNSFCFDDKGKAYMLDSINHRILKFDTKGNLLLTIGRIGQGEDELFDPTGIYIYRNELYILNKRGKEVKWYSLEGEYRSGFKLKPQTMDSKSFAVSDNFIYINQIEKENSNGKLIAVYSKEGKLLRKIGKGFKISAGFLPNLAFNSVYFALHEGTVYGSFKSVPAFFTSAADTKEEIFKKLKFKEFMEIEQHGKRKGHPKPESFSKASTHEISRIGVTYYTLGIAVDRRKDVFLCSNSVSAATGIVFRLNDKGKLKERIVLKLNNRVIRALKVIPFKTDIFALALSKQSLHLVKLNKT